MLSSTNSDLIPPYKYLAYGRGTCKNLFLKKKRPKNLKATPVYDEIVDALKANNSPHTNDVKFAHMVKHHFARKTKFAAHW